MTIDPEEYASAAVLFTEVGEAMLARLDWVKLQPRRIVEVACGVGHCTRLLQKRYPDAELFALDGSQEMLAYASQAALQHCHWVYVADEKVPLPDKSVDLIVANLVLPWSANIENILREWRRILQPEGLLMFTSLGLDTLKELNRQEVKTPTLLDMHDLGDLMVRAGFADPVMDVEDILFRYREEKKLWHELTVTKMILQPQTSLLLENPDGTFFLTYEIIYGHAWGPSLTAGQVVDGEGVVKIPLSHLRRS